MRRYTILMFAMLCVLPSTACVGTAPGQPDGAGSAASGTPGGTGSGTNGTGGSSGSGSRGFGPGEPQLIDTDDDGVPDAIDVEPDSDPDYLFDVAACDEPRSDANHDQHVDGIDLDCNGQVDLLVSPSHQVTPAPGANCFAGDPGEGRGHGAGGYGCN